MARITSEMLADIDKETVGFAPNYDGSMEEPLVLPARVPNLIINGSAGIAVGMATNIPPHNLGEIIDGLIMLLDSPDVDTNELMKLIKGPDFPTGGVIHGMEGIVEAYTSGRGLIKVRAKARIEQEHRGGENIIITELPYQVIKKRLIEKIAELVRDKKLEGISEIRDESDRDGIRVVLELKRGEMAEVVLNNLYKHTQMESTFGIIMLTLVNGQPRTLNLKKLLGYFLQHRRDVVIRRSKTPEEAKTALIRDYPLSEVQAQAILDMKLQRLTGLEREKIIKELGDTLKE